MGEVEPIPKTEAWEMKTRVATFQPRRVDNLKPDALPLVGYRGEWRALWLIDEGPYEGQWAWEPVERMAWWGWVPDEDLAD